MMSLMKPVAALAALVLLAGCSATPASVSSPPAVASATPTVSKVAMKASCSAAEAVIAALPVVPTQAEYAAAADQIHAVVVAGDQESANAFALLEAALRKRAAAKTGMEAVTTEQALITTLGTMADRCAIAGSSAFR